MSKHSLGNNLFKLVEIVDLYVSWGPKDSLRYLKIVINEDEYEKDGSKALIDLYYMVYPYERLHEDLTKNL